MNDMKKMKGLRILVLFVNCILMVVTLVLQFVAFQALLHSILCACILLLITVTLVFDGILKDSKEMLTHGFWYAIWFGNMIITFTKF